MITLFFCFGVALLERKEFFIFTIIAEKNIKIFKKWQEKNLKNKKQRFKTPAEVHLFVKCTQSDTAQRLALLLLREVPGSKAAWWQAETGGNVQDTQFVFRIQKGLRRKSIWSPVWSQDEEFHYSRQYWRMGKRWSIPFSEQNHSFERKKSPRLILIFSIRV